MNNRRPFRRSLSGNGRFRRLLGSHGKLKGLRSGLVALKPGESVGEHNTGLKEEVLVILKGRAAIYCAKRRISAQRNTFVYVPPKCRHNVKNIGAGPLKYVYITSRSG